MSDPPESPRSDGSSSEPPISGIGADSSAARLGLTPQGLLRSGVSPAADGSVVMDLDEAHPPGKVIELAANCVRFVLANLKVELDFTIDTLPLLDHYIAEARASIKERPESLALTAHAIGAYLGEVIRRRHTCWWPSRCCWCI